MKDSTLAHVTNISTVAPVGLHILYNKSHIHDLYSATHATPCYSTNMLAKTVPFIHTITLKNPDGTEVCVQALFNDGAMTGAMCSSVFKTIKHNLKGW